jgi:hypothetical protein
MTNKQALREAAEKAGAEVWCAFIDTKSKTYAVHTPDDDRCGDVVKWPGLDGQQRAAAKARFIAAANPATVLALLDELEAAESLAKQQGNIAVALFDEVTTLRRNADDKAPELRSQLEEAEKRIAELEAREVALPQRLQPGADGYDDWYVHSADDGEYLKVDDVIASIRAAGIRINGEG